jgi:hypothetical protein
MDFRLKKEIICYFNAYSVSIRFQELKGSIKQLRFQNQFLFQPFLLGNFPEILLFATFSRIELAGSV